MLLRPSDDTPDRGLDLVVTRLDVRTCFLTFFRSRIDPLPRTAILHIVSSCSRLSEFPFGPSSLPTKLNCGKMNVCVFVEKLRQQILSILYWKNSKVMQRSVTIGINGTLFYFERLIIKLIKLLKSWFLVSNIGLINSNVCIKNKKM